MLFRVLLFHALILSLVLEVCGQFRNYTEQYKELMAKNKGDLLEELSSLPDVNYFFHPSRAFQFKDSYKFDFPFVEEFRIGIIVDPCKYNSYNCCMNTFGSPEYGSLKRNGLEDIRVFKWHVLASDSDIQSNSRLVYEDGTEVPGSASRAPDDESYLDLQCDGLAKPLPRCLGKNYAQRRSTLRQACVDNNQTVNAIAGCFSPDGEKLPQCMAVAYTSNAFIPQCNNVTDPSHCGTWLEIHQLQGSPYQLESAKISEVLINQSTVSGYYTTTIPLTWFQNENTTLCSYTESFIRVGSNVFVNNPGVPRCCCPKPFKPATRVGGFFCPIGATGRGHFAGYHTSIQDILNVEPILLQFPFCPSGLDDIDKLWCGLYDEPNRRHYTRECSPVYQSILNEETKGSPVVDSWTSTDLVGDHYIGKCPYYDSCALPGENATTKKTECYEPDFQFTFLGYYGRVVAVDRLQNPAVISVTFNDGRTSYDFKETDLKLEKKSMYEIWWVVRTQNQFIVQKRKGFNVTVPRCTYDSTNDRYFPYAKLLNGVPQD